LAPQGVDFIVFDGVRDLPHFDPDLEKNGVPPAVEAWRTALSESDALVVASPEYGHSLPGSLKNAIDWVIGSGELEGKLVAITASTAGPDRGRRGLKALADTLAAVSAHIPFDEPIVRGATLESEVKRLLEALMVRLKP
jgi:NAD(P)H-dependent FMN reductase